MCDTVVALGESTANHDVLFGKNSDREFDEAQNLTLIPRHQYAPGIRVRLTYRDLEQARETYAVLLSRPFWIWGAEIAANEFGLVIGNEALFSKLAAPIDQGIIGMDYVRLAVERARNVDEAIGVITNLLREHGQGGNCGYRRVLGYHNSYLLADPKGAKVLETVDREWVVSSVRDTCAISNVFATGATYDAASPRLIARAREAGFCEDSGTFAFDTAFADPSLAASGRHRRARARHLLRERQGSIRVPDLFRVLRDHVEGDALPGRPSGPRICAHTKESPLGQTTASWVASLGSNLAVHWVTGTAAPCSGLFKPVVLGSGLPAHGPIAGPEPELQSLWWRHEQLRVALDRADVEQRATYLAERDAIEAQFIETMSRCPAVIDEVSRGEAKRLTDSCWNIAMQFESTWMASCAT